MENPDETPYRVNATQGGYEVRNLTGRQIILCSGEDNAGQYAALMNEAYQAGFKAGYRNGRRISKQRG